jgi:glycosyltransferase involved in cell wall biosynthesis
MTAKVSIGMPLYNAERYLERALEALLAQTFTDFELIISDNASTDSTWEICNTYAARDKRIKLYRNETNQGARKNFTRVLDLAQGIYFMWASYDDLWENNFLEACVKALEHQPDAVLSFPLISCQYDSDLVNLPLNFQNVPEEPWQRAIHLLEHKPLPNAIFYGLYRRSIIQQLLPMIDGYGNDSLWLLQCILKGSFVQVDAPLFTNTLMGKRDIRTRLHQYTGYRTGIGRLLYLDWKFVSNLFHITQTVAPNFQVRLRLAWVAIVFCYRNLGWPVSPRLIMRYGGLLLPETSYQRLLKLRKQREIR